MLITYPHMGTMAIVLKALFTSLGRQVLNPPPITRRTMELGTKNSPETVCLPFKVTLGNFIESLDQGADTIVTCGGVGPCRLGYYAEVQKGLLNQLGYKFDMIVIEPDIVDVLKHLHRVAYKKSLREIYHAFKFAGAKMNALDSIEKGLTLLRPRQKLPGIADSIWQQAVTDIDNAENIQQITNILQDTLFRIERDMCHEVQPLKIGLVGEIYVTIEPFINLNIERMLGNMGVEVHKTMYLSDYVRGHLLRKREYLDKYEELFSLAKPYLGHYVGGHGLKSIGHTIDMSQTGYDGVIQAYPFTCMPEVIAKNILPKVSQDMNIPVLSLVYDEQSGEAGIMTRLEAFIDLLKSRKRFSKAELD
ncbi:hypothetical protein SDC9_106045 [bioreactor metagenome]|uniref:DUF2229 domain-containing protein n=1 Tax=bioreactor metagenome TaxID=1076179 RepID=A0A645B168_9ZZZZ